jgi:uncharacterized membrane protein
MQKLGKSVIIAIFMTFVTVPVFFIFSTQALMNTSQKGRRLSIRDEENMHKILFPEVRVGTGK